MAISRTDVVAHLERTMRVGFLNGSKSYTPKRAAFTRTTPSDNAFEVYGDMGAVPWPQANAGQSGAFGTDGRTGGQQVGGLNEGRAITIIGGNERTITVYPRDWDVAIGIYHNAINDNATGDLEGWARSTGARFEQHLDYLAFDALNQGAANTYGLGYDGVTFVDASHIDPGAEYQTAQDNEYALTLSLPNFDTVYIAGAKFLDDRGKPLGLSHNLLVHAVDLRQVAAQVADNPEMGNTANREINPNSGIIRRLAAPGGWLDTTAWFLIDDSLPQKPINIQMRQAATLVFWDDHTQGSGVRYYKWVARYEVFYGDWRLLIQGNT